MPASAVYTQVCGLLRDHVHGVSESTLQRLTTLVVGIVGARSASPARIAWALAQLGLSGATVESIERRIRRTENDDGVTAAQCVHPLASHYLRYAGLRQVQLILDPTTQKDHLVMVCVGVWFRGRALPLAWQVWEGNVPMKGAGFWERIRQLLETVGALLPEGAEVTWLADRAFGTPQFTDLLVERGWHYVVRVQGHTVCRDRVGKETQVRQLVDGVGGRAKMRGEVFKKRGWRLASVVVHWAVRRKEPMCLVSDLAPRMELLSRYQRRSGIECLFRDYKSHGWRWEQGQVRELKHVERLLVAMALATWLMILLGAQEAAGKLADALRRAGRPNVARYSLFTLGLEKTLSALFGPRLLVIPGTMQGWDESGWNRQTNAALTRAMVLGPIRSRHNV
jgi:hypothetical protein